MCKSDAKVSEMVAVKPLVKRGRGRPRKASPLNRQIAIRASDAVKAAADRAGSEILREIIEAGLRQRKLLKL